MKLVIATALLAGFAGGIVSSHIVARPAEAQATLPAPRHVSAQSFALVDANGIPQGVFVVGTPLRPDRAPPILLVNAQGRTIWRAGHERAEPLD